MLNLFVLSKYGYLLQDSAPCMLSIVCSSDAGLQVCLRPHLVLIRQKIPFHPFWCISLFSSGMGTCCRIQPPDAGLQVCLRQHVVLTMQKLGYSSPQSTVGGLAKSSMYHFNEQLHVYTPKPMGKRYGDAGGEGHGR